MCQILLLTIVKNVSKIESIKIGENMEGNMKGLRKITFLSIVTIMAIGFGLMFSTTSKAATGSRYLTIKQLRSSGYGYKALEKNIWKICESNSSGTVTNYDHTIYCVKGGAGFGS